MLKSIAPPLVVAVLMLGVAACSPTTESNPPAVTSPVPGQVSVSPTVSVAPAVSVSPTASQAPPSGTPAAAEFKDIPLEGKGDAVVKFTIPADTPAIAVLAHKGKSDFIVDAVDEGGQTLGELADDFGDYRGTVLFGGIAGQHPVAFKIIADGTWTITIEPISEATPWDTSTALHGTGDGVYRLSPTSSGLGRLHLTFKGTGSFIVRAHTNAGVEELANEIDDFTGQVLLSGGTSMLEIIADGGSWSVSTG